MKKKLLLFLLFISFQQIIYSQLAVYKMIGKNANNSKLGFGLFAFTQFPLNDIGNSSIVLEWMDLAYFPPKDPDNELAMLAFLSIKVGYKYIFSAETKTGFYVEPSAGYCRVVRNDNPSGTFKDGFALAAEAGYTLEVGQHENSLNFGLKFESDRASTAYTVNSIGLRASYSFHLFRKRREK